MNSTQIEQEIGTEPFAWLDKIGNRIEGTIAALKEFISAREVFLVDSFYSDMNIQKNKLVILDDYDITALGVMDLMHNDENDPYFDIPTNQDFADVVTRILNDNNFEISIKTVKTLNTTSYGSSTILRMKHANSDYSSNYVDAIVNNSNPVVVSSGIHSNLETWYDFVKEISNEGRDAWKIEMLGGPITEDCSYGCPNYTFADLKDYYWPALIAGVEKYSGQNTIDYVGYSLGCSVALESLETHSSGENNIGYYFDSNGQWQYMDLAANPVDTFVGVACIGNFSPSSLVTEGNLPFFVDYIENNSDTYQDSSDLWYGFYDGHMPGGFYKSVDFVKKQIVEEGYWALVPIGGWQRFFAKVISSAGQIYLPKYALFPGYSSGTTSMKVYQDMINWMNNPNEPKPGLNVNLNNFAIIQSSLEKGEADGSEGSDLFVSNKDQQEICNNVQSSNKYYVSFRNIPHFDGLRSDSLAKKERAQKVISDFVEDKKVTQDGGYTFNTNCGQLE